MFWPGPPTGPSAKRRGLALAPETHTCSGPVSRPGHPPSAAVWPSQPKPTCSGPVSRPGHPPSAADRLDRRGRSTVRETVPQRGLSRGHGQETVPEPVSGGGTVRRPCRNGVLARSCNGIWIVCTRARSHFFGKTGNGRDSRRLPTVQGPAGRGAPPRTGRTGRVCRSFQRRRSLQWDHWYD
jgi:hypothetical protein